MAHVCGGMVIGSWLPGVITGAVGVGDAVAVGAALAVGLGDGLAVGDAVVGGTVVGGAVVTDAEGEPLVRVTLLASSGASTPVSWIGACPALKMRTTSGAD